MKRNPKSLLSFACGIVAAAIFFTSASKTQAAHPYDEHDGYYYHLYRLYQSSQVPVPPYFALHPPVYYSAPVPRTYGYSPYAYPPTTKTPPKTPPAKPVKPLMIINPFVPQKSNPKPKELKTVASSLPPTGPKMIINPFVVKNRAGLESK